MLAESGEKRGDESEDVCFASDVLQVPMKKPVACGKEIDARSAHHRRFGSRESQSSRLAARANIYFVQGF